MNRVLLFILCFWLAACQKDAGSGNSLPEPEQNLANVSYGTDAAQKMDIYLPAGRNTTTTKTIILIHGGAWVTGDKSDFAPFVDTLKQRLPGWAIININYRLATVTGNFFPSQENDVKAAIEFIAGKTAEYKIAQKFVLLGASAGGHLALLQGYKYNTPVRVKAIVDFFGPTDLVALHDHPADPSLVPVLELLLGGTPTSNAAMYQQSSPVNFVNAQSPPTIILQGGLDPLVPVTQATSLDSKLQTAGVVHQYVFYPTEGHGWTGANLTHSFNAIQAFLSVNVN